MSPSLNQQTNTKSHKREEQRPFLILGPFLRKNLAKKRHDVWYQCANDSPNRTVKWTGTDATFFSVKWKKALSGSTLYANSFTSFFSNFFNLILISQKSVKLQSVFQNFFFPIIATHWLKYEKKILWTLWKHTSIYMKLWFLTFTSCQPLIYLFNEVAQIFYQYIARMCINMISLGGDKLKCPCF